MMVLIVVMMLSFGVKLILTTIYNSYVLFALLLIFRILNVSFRIRI